MHRKLDFVKYLSLLILVYISFLGVYMKFGVGREILEISLLIVKDFLLPVGAFSLGIKFEKRKVFWLLVFIFICVLSRIINIGDLYEVEQSLFLLIAYYFGGLFYREKSEKTVLFTSLVFVNLGILLIPDISVPLYSSVMNVKSELATSVSSYTGIGFIIISWLVLGIEYWSYALEVFEKLVIGFFVVKVHNIFVRRIDYSLDFSYFHRRFGIIILEAFMLILLLKSLGYNGIFQYSIAIFAVYFFFTGAIEIFTMAKLAKVLNRGLIKRYAPYIWIAALIFFSFEVSFVTVIVTIIYSAYVATIGKHNIMRLLNDTIKRIKGV